MSIEDTTKLVPGTKPTIPNGTENLVGNTNVKEIPKEKDGFFIGQVKSFGQSLKKNYEISPFSAVVDTAKDIGTLFTGNDDDKKEVATRANENTGGYFGAIGDFFDPKVGATLDNDENKHSNVIKGFQDNLGKANFIASTGLDELDILGFKPFGLFDTDDIEFKKGDRSEVQMKFNEIDKAPLPDHIQKQVNVFSDKYNLELNSRLDKIVKQEIKDKKLLNDQNYIYNRKQELLQDEQAKLDEDYNEDIESLNKSIVEYRNVQKKIIADEYVQPREGKSPLDTFNYNISDNAAVRTQQYIGTEIVDTKMEEIMQGVQWNSKLASDSVFSDMISTIKEKITRDQTNYYENLAAVKDPEKRAKIKGMLLPQMEARETLFRDVLKKYETEITKLDDISTIDNKLDYTKDKIISQAYRDAISDLSEENRKALVIRDGTDTVMAMYYNTEELKRRADQGGAVGTILAIGNVLQLGMQSLDLPFGSAVSAIASATIKQNDTDKIFYDEYELTTAADALPIKLFKHIVYNTDDITEVLNIANVGNKINVPAKAIGGVTTTLKNISTNLRKARSGQNLNSINKLFNYSVDTGLTTSRVGLYGLRGGLEGGTINPNINKQMRITDTDANAMTDFFSDMFIEPFAYKTLGSSTPSIGTSAIDSAISGNSLVQNSLSYMLGEVSAKDAVKFYMEQNPKLTQSEAYKLMATQRDFVYSITDQRLSELFDVSKAKDKAALEKLYKNFSDAYEKLKSGDLNKANKMITTGGGILKVDNLTTLKSGFENEVDRGIKLSKSEDLTDAKIGNAILDKQMSDIISAVQGNKTFQEAIIKLNPTTKAAEVAKFTGAINVIKAKKASGDLDGVQLDMIKLFSDLYTLRNSTANLADKISAVLTLMNPITNEVIQIPVDNLNKLLEFEGGVDLQKLNDTGILEVTDKNKVTLGLDKAGTYSVSAKKGNLFNKLSSESPELLKLFNKGLNEGSETHPYSSGSNQYTYEEIDKLKKILGNYTETTPEGKKIYHEGIFGKDIGYVDAGTSKDNKLVKGKRFGRQQYADDMANTQAKIVITYGEMLVTKGPNKGEVKNLFYIGVGKEMTDLGFDVSGTFKEYHAKSSKIIKDIFSQVTIQDGIDLARPLNNIGKFETITYDAKKLFIKQLLKENKIIEGDEINKKGLDIEKFIMTKFTKEADQDPLAKYIFEVFATRVVKNFELFKKVDLDLNRLNNAKDIDSNKIIKTIDNFNTLIDSLSGEKTITRGSEEMINQFDLNHYKKEAELKYEEIIKQRTEAITRIENQLQELDSKLFLAEEINFNKNQKDYLERKLKIANETFNYSKKEFIENYSKLIFKRTYDSLYKAKLIKFDGIINSLPQSKKTGIRTLKDTEKLVNAISKRTKEIETMEISLKSGKTQVTQDPLSDVEKVGVDLTIETMDKLKKNIQKNKSEIKKLQTELSKADSLLQQEVNVIKNAHKMPTALKIVYNKQNLTLEELYRAIAKEESIEYLSTVDGAIEDLLSKVAGKTKIEVKYNAGIPEPIVAKVGIFSKDAIRFISKEQLLKNIRHLVDNKRDLDISKKENPIFKAFNTAFSGAGNSEEVVGEQLFAAIKKDFTVKEGTDPKTLQELYFSSNDFKAKIDSFKFDIDIKGKNLTPGVKSNISIEAGKNFRAFKSFLDEYIKGVETKSGVLGLRYELVDGATGKVKSVAESRQLLANDKMYSDLYVKFKTLHNASTDGITIARELVRYKNGYPIYKLTRKEGQIKQNSLFETELKENGLEGFRSISINKVDDLKYLSVGENITINNILKTKLLKSKKSRDDYNTGIETLKVVTDIANGLIESKNKDSIREQLGLQEGEYIMGTYGDKETSLQVYKAEGKTFKEAEVEFTEKYIESGGFKTEEGFVSISDIVKRESALASTKKEFGDVEIDTKTLVLGEEIHTTGTKNNLVTGRTILANISEELDRINPKRDLDKQTELFIDTDTYVDMLINLDPTLTKERFEGKTLEELESYVDTVYATDLFDGTSYMSDALAKMHDLIDKGMFTESDRAKKFHYTGYAKDNNRFLAKTLFNRADIQVYDKNAMSYKTQDNVVLIGESSLKLKGGLSKSKVETVRVNGRTFKVVGEIEGTNTGGFKDAASDAQTIKEDQTLSEQIVNLMDYDVLTAYKGVMVKEVEKLFEETLGGLGGYDQELASFGDMNLFLNNLQKLHNVGGTTDSMINARLKSFLDGYKELISGSTEKGASHTILYSLIDLPKRSKAAMNTKTISRWSKGKTRLERNEIIVSKESHLYKNAVRDLKTNIDSLQKEISEGITNEKILTEKNNKLIFLKDQLENKEIYITGLRNPIPNKENLGVYKVILAEDVGLGKEVKSDDVILHPETTYMKIQGDNDGDHFVMFPIISDKSELIARTAMGLDMAGDLYGTVKSDYNNTIAIITQTKADRSDKTFSLSENRFKNLEAKLSISTGMSVIRGANILLQYQQAIITDHPHASNILKIKVKGKEIIIKKGKIFEKDKYETVQEIFDNIKRLEGNLNPGYGDVFKKSNTYGSETGSIVQLIMDYAKDKTGNPFPKEVWIKDMMKSLGLKNPETIKYLFNNILSPMGASHKAGDKSLNLAKVRGLAIKKNSPMGEKGILAGILGYRRSMFTDFGNKYAQIINKLSNATEPEFILEKMKNEFDPKTQRGIILNKLVDTVIEKKTNFITQDTRDIIQSDFQRLIELEDQAKLNLKDRDVTNIVLQLDELYLKHTNEVTGRINHHKIISEFKVDGKDIINSKGELAVEKSYRDLVALYSLSKGNSNIFNLLTDGDKLDLLNFSDEKRLLSSAHSIYKYNRGLEPIVILSKNIPINKKIDQLRSTKNKLENDIGELSSDALEMYDEYKLKNKELSNMTESIDDIEDAGVTDYGEIRESIDSIADGADGFISDIQNTSDKINDLEQEIVKLDEYINGLTKNSDKEIADATILEEFGTDLQSSYVPDDYISNLNLTHKIGERDFIKLMDDFKSASSVDSLLRDGIKLKFESVLSSWRPEIMGKVLTARDLNGSATMAVKELMITIEQGLKKEIKALGSLKGTEVRAYDEILARIKKHTAETDKGHVFNAEGYLEDLGKFSVKKFEANESEIINKYGKKIAEDILPPLMNGLNQMDQYYKDSGGYKLNYGINVSGGFLQDLIGLFTGDFEFELRRLGIITKTGTMDDAFVGPRGEFNKYMKEGAEANGTKFNIKQSNDMYDVLFVKKDDSLLLSLIRETQAAYYHGAYQTTSLFLGGVGHIAGLTQVLGNTIEMLGFLRKATPSQIAEASKVVEEYKLLGEDAGSHGQRLGEQNIDTKIGKLQKFASEGIKGIVKKMTKELGTKDPLLQRRLMNIIDTTITEPLLATDMLQDAVRRQASAIRLMEIYGVKTKDQLDKVLTTSREKDKFKILFYREHNDMGGGVISNMPIFKETFLTRIGSQTGMGVGFTTKVFFQLYKFLNGWAFHKFTTGIERQLAGGEAIRLFMKGDKHGGNVLMKEFIDYNTAMLLNIGMAAGLGAKISKYDYSDEDDKTNKGMFIESAVNNLAALEILFDRELGNLQGRENESMALRMQVTTIEMFKHMTRVIKNNPFNFFKTIPSAVNRHETLGEGYLEAFYMATQNSVGSYMRNAHGLLIGSMYDQMKGQDSLSMFGYGIPSNLRESQSELQKANRSGRVSTLGYGASIGDIFISFMKPQYLGNAAITTGVNQLLSTEEVKNLYDKGIGAGGYNLDTILVNDGELDQVYTEKAWNNIVVYQGVGQQLDDKGRKILTAGKDLYSNKMDDIITKALADIGYTKEDFVNRPSSRTIALQKLFYETKQKDIPELSVAHLTSYIATNRFKEIQKEIKEEKGIEYKDAFYFEQDEQAGIKYKVLKELSSQGLLNANLENVKNVFGLHIEKNQPELYKHMQEAGASSGLKDYMNGLAISTRNLQEGDTNAKYLTSEYTKSFKGLLTYYSPLGKRLEPTAEAVELVKEAALVHIREITNSTQPGKEQTAKIASVLSGMNDSSWDMLRDNDVFNLLTLPAQRQLISWTYKTATNIQDFDADSIANYQVSNFGSGSGKSKYFPNYFKNGQSSSFAGGPRPGFGKQFPQMSQFLKGKTIPENFDRIAYGSLPQKSLQLNYLNFPIIKEINSYFIQESFKAATQPTKSKVYIKKGTPKKGFVKSKQKKISLPKPSRSKTSPIKIRKTTIKGLPGDITSN